MITIGSIRDVDLDLARELSETNREAGALEMPEAARVAAANDVVQGAAIEWVAESEAAGVAAQAALNVRASAEALAERDDARRHGRRDGDGEGNPLEIFTAPCTVKPTLRAGTGHAGPHNADDAPREFAAPGGVTWIRVAVAMAAVTLLAAHLLQPHGMVGDATFLAVICGAAAMAWVGALRRPRGASRIPVLIAAGITANALAELIWFGYVWAGLEPDVSVADLGFLLTYVGLTGALVLSTLVRSGGRAWVDPESIIDALTIIVVSVLIFWDLSIAAIVAGHHGLWCYPDRVGDLPGSRRDSAGDGRAGLDVQAFAVHHRTRIRRRGCVLAGSRHRIPGHRLHQRVP